MANDGFTWKAHAHVDKFTAEQVEACKKELALGRDPTGAELIAFCDPVETADAPGNLVTRIGLQRFGNRLIGTGSWAAINATTGRIGVGNGTTAAAVTDTDLSAAAGAANRQFLVFDSAPTVGTGATSGVYTFVATFGTGVGNFAWQEWGIDGGTASGTTVTTDAPTTPGLINHQVISLGTKTGAQTWVMTVTITGS